MKIEMFFGDAVKLKKLEMTTNLIRLYDFSFKNKQECHQNITYDWL